MLRAIKEDWHYWDGCYKLKNVRVPENTLGALKRLGLVGVFVGHGDVLTPAGIRIHREQNGLKVASHPSPAESPAGR